MEEQTDSTRLPHKISIWGTLTPWVNEGAARLFVYFPPLPFSPYPICLCRTSQTHFEQGTAQTS